MSGRWRCTAVRWSYCSVRSTEYGVRGIGTPYLYRATPLRACSILPFSCRRRQQHIILCAAARRPTFFGSPAGWLGGCDDELLSALGPCSSCKGREADHTLSGIAVSLLPGRSFFCFLSLLLIRQRTHANLDVGRIPRCMCTEHTQYCVRPALGSRRACIVHTCTEYVLRMHAQHMCPHARTRIRHASLARGGSAVAPAPYCMCNTYGAMPRCRSRSPARIPVVG